MGTSQLQAALEQFVKDVVRKELALAVDERRRDSEYLSTSEAATFARVTPGTIRRWIREGRLDAHRAGREIRVRRDAVEALMSPRLKLSKKGAAIVSPEAIGARLFG